MLRLTHQWRPVSTTIFRSDMGLKTIQKKKQEKDGPILSFEKEYRDRITGFTGFCVGLCFYVSGCDQALIVPKVDKDGKYQEGRWFDDERLIDVEAEQRVQRSSIRGVEAPAPIIN